MHEAEYQWAEAKGRAADCKDRVESETHKRDQLEDLVLKLKLYILGGASSVGTMRAPAGKTLPRDLKRALDSHEQLALDEIFANE